MNLNKIEQIAVLESAKTTLEKTEDFNAGFDGGLCAVLQGAITEECGCVFLFVSNVQQCITDFTFENAVKYANASNNGMYWWGRYDKENRLKFIEWMINQLKEAKI